MELKTINDTLAEHFTKVDKLVKYYMEHMDTEHGTIQEALEYLFTELESSDMDRAIEQLNSKTKKG